MNAGILWRLILSVAVLVTTGVINFAISPYATLMSAEMAGKQFENNDTAYVTAVYGMGIAGHLGISALVVLIILAIIWIKPIRATVFSLAGLGLGLALSSHPANAYYQKNDYTEVLTVYPNETAFWIPDNGGNKDSQGKLDSAEYYQNNKVPLKRFIIPHTALSGSGWGPWGNYVVPSGRLILVDRTPYNREWVKATERGTSNRDQSFPCQDNQGHDVTVEITIGASVFEDNAAKFLYRFGVKPPSGPNGAVLDRTQPEVIFTSVYYGRSLIEVMDSNGRGAVQAIVCKQISIRDADHVNLEADQMMTSITKSVTDYFIGYGITLDYIGWAGTFTFSPGVQSAMDRTYIAQKDESIAKLLQPYATTIQQLAAADALRAFGDHTDGKLPTTIVGLPANVTGLLGSLLSTPAQAAPATH
jgi:hypothetical protein